MANLLLEDIEYKNFEDLQYQQLKTGVKLTLFDSPATPNPAASFNLFAVSNIYGYFVAGTSSSFVFDTLAVLRSAFKNGEPDELNKFKARTKVKIANDALRIIRLSADESTVVVALAGGHVHMYSISNLLANPDKAIPDAKVSLESEILDIRPNPSTEKNGLAAVLLTDQTIRLISMDGSSNITLNKDKYTALAWSTKGKQIMCGTETGALHQIDPEGVLKKQHVANPANEGQSIVAINWIETTVFIVVYCLTSESGDNEFNVCLISKENPAEPRYLSFGDMCFPMMNPDFGLTYYMTPSIKSWGSNIKELINVTSSSSLDVGIIARAADGSWEKWDLDDTGRPAVPGMEAVCVGTALDFTSEAALPPLDEDAPEIPPVPIMYTYNNCGELSAYHVLNMETAKEGMPCPVMVKAQPLPQASAKAKVATSAPTPAPIAKPVATPALQALPTPSAPPLKAAQPVSKPPPPATISFKAPAAAPMASQNKPPMASKGMFGGSATPFSSAPLGGQSSPMNPNTAFQQSKPVLTKQQQPGVVQKLLQEPEESIRIVRTKDEDVESPTAPAPKVSEAMDALSRQLENAYLSMTEELKTLHTHVRETEELVRAREHVFVELDQFMSLTTRRIRYAKESKVLSEAVLADFVKLRADLIKVTSKRDEIGRLLRSRQDPLSDENISNVLNPADLSQQRRMKKSFEVIDGRLRELEDFVEALNVKASRLRNGYEAEGPTLDSIRRSIRNISSTLIQRQVDLDELSSELDRLGIAESLNPAMSGSKHKKSTTAQPQKNPRLSESYAARSQQRPLVHVKVDLARQLKHVFTSNPRSQPISTSLGLSTSDGPLSILPQTEQGFVAASEPRRSEAKKRLSTVISSQTETSVSSNFSAAPAMTFAKTTPNTGSAPAPVFGTPPKSFGVAPEASAPVTGFGASTVASFGSTPPPAFGSGFALASNPVSTSGQVASHSFGSSAPSASPAPAFTGFQIPQSMAGTTAAMPTPAWNVPKSLEQPKGFAFQIPKSEAPSLFGNVQATSNMFSSTQSTSIPAFSFAKPASEAHEGEQEVPEGSEDEDEQHDHPDGDEEEYEEEEAYEDEYEQDPSGRRRVRYVHDGKEYEVEEGSEPESWGSDTDQRDDGHDEEEEAPEEEELHEGEEAPEEDEAEDDELVVVSTGKQESSVVSKAEVKTTEERKEQSTKSSWEAPGFKFPAVAPAPISSSSSTTSSSTFSFFTASASKAGKEGNDTTPPKPSSDKAAESNTFGSTAAFSFGTPLPSTTSSGAFATAPSNPGDKTNTSGLEQEPAATPSAKTLAEDSTTTSAATLTTQTPREKQPADSGDEEEQVENQNDGPSEAEDAKAEHLDQGTENGGGSSSVVSASAAPVSGSTPTFGSKPVFGDVPAFGFPAESKSSKVSGMSFVKLPRARRESRDSLDSDTSDDEAENVMSDEGGSPVFRGRDATPTPVTGFGKPADNSNAGGLDSFSLSLGGGTTSKNETKSSSNAWGTSSVSSWGSVSQTSAQSGGWGASSTLGSVPPATSAPTSTSSPFAATSTSTSWGSGGTGFGQTSQLGSSTGTTSAFGQTSQPSSGTTTAFGQTSKLGGSTPGFGQTSQLGSGTSTFGQTSQPGSGTPAFGQTSQLGSGTSAFGQTSTTWGSSGTAFGQTSTLGGGAAFGQTSTLGGSTPAFGQTSTLGGGFGQSSTSGSAFGQTSTLGGTAFGQTSQLGGGTSFGQASQLGGGSTFGQSSQFGAGSGFGSFASTGSNAFASLASNGPNVLDQEANQSGGFGTGGSASAFGSGGGNTQSVFGSGGGFGGGGNSAFGTGGGFGGSNTGFGSGFGGAQTGFGQQNSGTNAFGSGSNPPNVDQKKSSFTSFR